jgi:hypothetical protein
MPAQIVARAVTMRPDAGAKLLHFRDQVLARHRFQIFVHAHLQVRPASSAACGLES